MRLLVTGGAGYIGSAVSSPLAKEEQEVAVLDNNLSKSYREAGPEGDVFMQRDLLGAGLEGVFLSWPSPWSACRSSTRPSLGSPKCR